MYQRYTFLIFGIESPLISYNRNWRQPCNACFNYF